MSKSYRMEIKDCKTNSRWWEVFDTGKMKKKEISDPVEYSNYIMDVIWNGNLHPYDNKRELLRVQEINYKTIYKKGESE